MSTQRTPTDLARYIQEHGIAAELVFPPQETPTVAQAAQALGCTQEQIVKSVLFLIRDGGDYAAVLVITNGAAQIDFRKLADVFQVGRKRIRLALPEMVLAITGFPAGGVPPFGFEQAIPTFIDESVFDQTVVYGGGGDEWTLLRITPQELQRATSAETIRAR